MRLLRAMSILVWVSSRTVQPLGNLWWCLISHMVKNCTIKILLDLFFPFECFSSDCNPIFCLAYFTSVSVYLLPGNSHKNHKHFRILKQETIAFMTALLFFDIKGLLILYKSLQLLVLILPGKISSLSLLLTTQPAKSKGFL